MDEKEESADIGSVFGFGLSVVLLSLLFFAAAANGAAALALFTAAALALTLTARLWGRLGLIGLDVVLSARRNRFFPGETLEISAEIANRKPLPVWMRLELGGSAGFSCCAEGGAEGESALMPFERRTGSWSFTALRRGVFRLGPATVAAGDLLGLYRKERMQPVAGEIVVYPRVVPVSELEPAFRDYFGIHPSKGIIEDPAWYEGTREYSGNRPAKNIHWKASARLDALQEKIFQPTSHRKVFFLFDSSGFLETGDRAGFEEALATIASLVARFAETGASFAAAADCRVDAFPAALPLGRGPEHFGRTLELLARCAFEPGAELARLFSSVNATGAGFVVVSRGPTERSRRFFGLPAARRDRVLFLFLEDDAGDEAAPYPAASFRRTRSEGGPIGAAAEAGR